ncbi:hypothetical protein diail_9503, partial [Diaporthe ilicicola]
MLSLKDLPTICLLWAISTSLVRGQRTTYTGCHNHTEASVAIEYCYGPDGAETARATHAVAGATSLPESVSVSASSTAQAQTTAVTGCHSHETAVLCINGAGEEVHVDATPTGDVPPAYCMDPAGNNVAVHAEGEAAEEESHVHGDAHVHGESEGQNCHFHAGVEHCVGGSESEGVSCGLHEREYNVGLRVGSLFIVLVTSAIGVFAPLVLHKLVIGNVGATAIEMIKQVGTGIIISTAFIHLYTHAQLMFSNECIGELSYEGTTSAIVMAGIFLSFLVEFVGLRVVAAHAAREPKTSSSTEQTLGAPNKDSQNSPTPEEGRNAFASLDHHHHAGPNNHLSVLVMEAGIIFHSVLIGLTLVVSGDSFYQTLLVVIVFHQFFEGLALGARISLLPGSIFPWKFVMAIAFALITPIGMAIGIGVLNTFNGNNPSTVITFGTLDALSAGILLWVGVVDMWARDWVIEGGELLSSGILKTIGAGASLCA